ncbi:MAG: polar amino acid transport system substrate-binding protein [Myxococcota bacterium]|jgi:polar amino acid transport system substrate-binding protein
MQASTIPPRRRLRLVLGAIWLVVLGMGSVPQSASAEPSAPPVATAEAAKPDPEIAADRPLLVATKVFKPFSFKHGDDTWVGFSVDIWDAIAVDLGLEYQWYGTASVAEVLDAVRTGPAQVGTAGITITGEREKDLDFSFPFFESGLQIMVLDKAQGAGSVFGTLLPVLLPLLGMGILVMLIIGHFVWFFERKKNPEMFNKSYRSGIWDGFWWAGVTLTTVGYGDRIPRTRWGRGLALVWMFSGIIMISYFTATVTTSLTIDRLEGSIQGPSDLPGKRVGTVRGSTAAKWLYASAVKIEEYEAIEEVYEALNQGLIEAVVYDSPALLYYASHEGKGIGRVVGKVFQKQSYGIALKTKSPLHEQINRALLKLRESGTYEEIYRKWFGS